MAPRPRRRRARHLLRVAVACVAACVATACGDDEAGPDGGGFSTDIQVGSDDVAFTFGQDTTTPATGDAGQIGEPPMGDSVDTADPDGVATDASTATDSNSTSDAQGGDANVGPETVQADIGDQPTTTCAGSCGVFLEGNPCHCHHGCVQEGNCCAGFQLDCACQKANDCDDGSACTQDSCFNNLCKQIPSLGCCKTAADCTGGDECSVATCEQGACALLPKDCSDGVACTLDVCDSGTGECGHKLDATTCLIEGACIKAGTGQPGTDSCVLCQPDVDALGWTAKADHCFIDGLCYAKDANDPAAKSCTVCDPAKSASAWSLQIGTCYVDGGCYLDGSTDPANPECGVCAPSKSQTAWSGKANTCAVGGVCYGAGEADPLAQDCRACQPDVDATAFTVTDGWCWVDGLCKKAGEDQSGSGGCAICDPKTSTGAWTVETGAACDDGISCTLGDKCGADATCKGKLDPLCCQITADCKNLQEKAEPCEKAVCNGQSGQCELQTIEGCCVQGACCNVPLQTLQPMGTKCADINFGNAYQCDGNNVLKAKKYPGCTGAHYSKCLTDTPALGAWELAKACQAPQVCVIDGDGIGACK